MPSITFRGYKIGTGPSADTSSDASSSVYNRSSRLNGLGTHVARPFRKMGESLRRMTETTREPRLSHTRSESDSRSDSRYSRHEIVDDACMRVAQTTARVVSATINGTLDLPESVAGTVANGARSVVRTVDNTAHQVASALGEGFESTVAVVGRGLNSTMNVMSDGADLAAAGVIIAGAATFGAGKSGVSLLADHAKTLSSSAPKIEIISNGPRRQPFQVRLQDGNTADKSLGRSGKSAVNKAINSTGLSSRNRFSEKLTYEDLVYQVQEKVNDAEPKTIGEASKIAHKAMAKILLNHETSSAMTMTVFAPFSLSVSTGKAAFRVATKPFKSAVLNRDHAHQMQVNKDQQLEIQSLQRRLLSLESQVSGTNHLVQELQVQPHNSAEVVVDLNNKIHHLEQQVSHAVGKINDRTSENSYLRNELNRLWDEANNNHFDIIRHGSRLNRMEEDLQALDHHESFGNISYAAENDLVSSSDLASFRHSIEESSQDVAARRLTTIIEPADSESSENELPVNRMSSVRAQFVDESSSQDATTTSDWEEEALNAVQEAGDQAAVDVFSDLSSSRSSVVSANSNIIHASDNVVEGSTPRVSASSSQEVSLIHVNENRPESYISRGVNSIPVLNSLWNSPAMNYFKL